MAMDIFGASPTDLVGVAQSGQAVIRFDIGSDSYDLLASNVSVQAQEDVQPVPIPAEPKDNGTDENPRVLLIGQLGIAQVQIGSFLGGNVESFLEYGGRLVAGDAGAGTEPGITDRDNLEIFMYNSSIDVVTDGPEDLEKVAKFELEYWKINQVAGSQQAGGEGPFTQFQYSIMALNAYFDIVDTSELGAVSFAT